MIIILTGVSGVGKTTIGKLLAKQLGSQFLDADDFHPDANVEKMRSGIPLTDEDRIPWLNRLADELHKRQNAVLACSALKRSYREVLTVNEKVRFVLLYGDFELIKARLKARKGHYMNPDLLQSQFDALEISSDDLTIDVDDKPVKIVERIILALKKT